MTIRLFSGAIMAALLATTPLAAQQGDSFQGTSLLGERMVTPANGNKNVADPALLDRAAADAKAAFEFGRCRQQAADRILAVGDAAAQSIRHLMVVGRGIREAHRQVHQYLFV